MFSVGAGAAGATLAGRLSEDKHATTCLIEAGKATEEFIEGLIETPMLSSNVFAGPITYNHTTVPQLGLNKRVTHLTSIIIHLKWFTNNMITNNHITVYPNPNSKLK